MSGMNGQREEITSAKVFQERRIFLASCGWLSKYGPFLGTLNIRGRIIIGTQKRTIILTTTHVFLSI